MIMLYDKIQITFDLKLRARPLHRAPVVAPPSFSAPKKFVDRNFYYFNIANHWEPLIENSSAPTAIRLKLPWRNYGHKHCP